MDDALVVHGGERVRHLRRDAKRPRERLLFVGNDNDFRTRKGFMPDGTYDGGIDHDNMVLVYRVSLPAS